MKRSEMNVAVIVIVAAIAAAMILYLQRQPDRPSPPPEPIPVPIDSDCGGPGGSCPVGYRCIQKCGPPVVREGDAPPGYYCAPNSVADKPQNCPICLASQTMISTPSGSVNVKDIAAGMMVWSLNAAGQKVASVVRAVGSMAAPAGHRVVYLVLADGREVLVSPNHPTLDGGTVGSLQVGDEYDGSRVISADLLSYDADRTYDLLPDSDTGAYWADGILLGSTLSKQ